MKNKVNINNPKTKLPKLAVIKKVLANKTLNKGRVLSQLNNIKENLKNNKQNYFVNTAGFKKLLKKL